MTDQEKLNHLEQLLAKALIRVSELEALVLKLSTPKNSTNSSIPPCVDFTYKNQSLRGKSNKPVGGQKGHQGHTLKMSDTPDIIEKISPNFCNACGLSLIESAMSLMSARQVIDIPPIVPTVTEYQCFSAVCTCGHHQKSNFPEGVTNHIQYGPNIETLIVYNSVYQFLPFARLQDFFKKVINVNLSKATIENVIRRTSKKAIPAYEAIKEVISISFFVGSDETGFKLNKRKGWFWVWQNALVTYIVAACTRSKEVINEQFPHGLPNTILCTDRLPAQLSTFSKGIQICLAHLLRDLNYLIELENANWATEFRTLLKDAITLKQSLIEHDKNDSRILQIEHMADKLLESSYLEALNLDNQKYKQTITFYNAMNKLRHGLFPFLYDPRVPFDNNSSERAIRNVKIKTKVSGQFKSLHQEFAIIRSVIDTAIKNGKSVYHAINEMVNMPMPQTVSSAG